MLTPTGSDGDTKYNASEVAGLAVERGERHGHRCPTRIEIGLGFRTLDTIGLVQPVEDGVDVLPKIFI